MKIAGHLTERKALKKIAEKELIPQSYLFAGPRSIGKKLAALEFSAHLIDMHDDPVLGHADLLILQPPVEEEKGKVKRKRISVEEIRKGILFLSRYPIQGKKRVLIIDQAEEMTPEASNALLKSLEEPNATSILILITHKPASLLPTILSRAVTITFHPIPESELREFFLPDGKDLPDFFYFLGLPGLIVNALQEPERFENHKESLARLFKISKLSLRDRLKLAENLAQNEEELPILLEEWLMGMHARIEETEDPVIQARLLILFERLLGQISALTRREGNPRLLLEEMFLSL